MGEREAVRILKLLLHFAYWCNFSIDNLNAEIFTNKLKLFKKVLQLSDYILRLVLLLVLEKYYNDRFNCKMSFTP